MAWFLETFVSFENQSWARRAQMYAGNLKEWDFTSAYLLLEPLYQLCGRIIPVMDMIILILIWLLGARLAIELEKINKKTGTSNSKSLWPWLALSCLGILSYYTKNISEYNHLAVIFVLASCLLLVLTARRHPRKALEAIWQGILMGLLMSVKISAGLLWSIAVWIWWFTEKKKHLGAGILAQAIMYPLICLVSGSGIFSLEKHPALYVFGDFNSVLKTWLSFVGLGTLVPEKGYFLVRLAILNTVEVAGLTILLGLIIALGKQIKNKNIHKAALLILACWIISSWIFFFFGGDPRQTVESHNYNKINFWIAKLFWYGSFTAIPLMIYLALSISSEPRLPRLIGSKNKLGVLMGLGPLLCSLGTSFRLSQHFLIYSWMFILSAQLLLKEKSNNFKNMVFVTGCALLSIQIIANQGLQLKKIENLNSAKYSLQSMPNGKFLTTSKKTFEWIQEIKRQSNRIEIKKGEYIVTINEYMAPFILNNKICENLDHKSSKWAIYTRPIKLTHEPVQNRKSLIIKVIGPPIGKDIFSQIEYLKTNGYLGKVIIKLNDDMITHILKKVD